MGRAREIAMVADRMASARSGRAQAVVVRGPAGSGKTGLLDAVLAEPWCEGAEVLRATCGEPDTPFAVVRALFAPFGLTSSALTPDGLQRLAVDLMDDRPLVVVLNRVQRCDARSLRWVELLLRRSGDLPLAILLSERTGEPARTDAVLADIAAHERCRTLDLEPVVPGVELDDKPASSRAVARAIAVLGSVGPELVGALAGMPVRQVVSAVDDLRGSRLLTSTGLPADNSALDELSADELMGLRARAARLLNDAGYPAGRVADQLLSLPFLSERWMLDTLRDAANGAEVADAARYLRPVFAAEPYNIEVRVELAGALCQTDPASALRLLRETLGMTSAVRIRAKIAVRFALASVAVQRAPEAVHLLREVLEALNRELGDGTCPADLELVTMVHAALLATGMEDRSTVVAARGSGIQAPAGDTRAERQLLGVLGVVSATGGESAESAVGHARQALRIQRVELGGLSFLTSALVLFLADEPAEALAALDMVVDASGQRGAVWTHCAALAVRSTVLTDAGELNEAAVDARAAVRLADGEKWREHAVGPRIALASVLVKRHDPEGAQAVLDQITLPGLSRLVWDYPRFLMAKAEIAWTRGDRESALDDLLACGRALDETGIVNPLFVPWWLEAACLLAELERPWRAMGLVEHGEDLARRWETTQSIGLCLLARGVVTRGRTGVAPLEAAVDLLGSSSARPQHARAEYLFGRALVGIDDVKGGRLHLRQAVDLAVRCGCRSLAVAARDCLVAAGGRMRPLTGARADALTGSERRVATMAATGATNRAIAESLVVSVRTVEVHLTSAYRKLGVTGRAHLAAVLRRDPADRSPL
jgi:DNA-binding CsgD family transcriptional regulator